MANGQPRAGRFALVTGASKGVGKGIALELGRQGCQVAVNYNSDLAGAEATVAELANLGAGGFAIRANVGVRADVESMFAAVLERFGRLDVMVNNAGVQTWKPLLELTEAEWDKVIDTNLKGAFLCTQLAARAMKASGGGAIINIGSGCNKWAFPNLVDYTASKGGIEQFTKVAAVELGPYQIRVNCVAPGSVEVERTKAESGVDYATTWSKLTPLGRIGVPADIGNVVAFLASPKADFVTGQTIYVDGGLFCKPAWPY
ncbi:MAG TPA: 3-oxoacyl-ACP reductase family protein [Paludibaculum sp.]|jgi:NAD(P)-dependent dehydrogenase (short-subunit alcohol dehydrogenase family)